MKRNFTVVIERDNESGGYVGFVPGVPGAHTQADTIEELHIHLKEVIELCVVDMDEEDKKYIPDFVALSQVEAAV
ncbi:MAG: type II toxin-antitoxin system HicB family antitoxin [Oscillospiraceae bacterium]|nr:type II toxin-antitoxin system HicB family antitoxin [Oscillospiraceae bacterium]